MTTIFDVPGSNPPNPLAQHIQALARSNDPDYEEIAAKLINAVTTSPDPSHTLWELWDAFFIDVAKSTDSQNYQLTLLDAIRAHPPTKPSMIRPGSDAERKLRSFTQDPDGKLHWSTLPRFSAHWRDVHDILEAWRDWDGVRDSRGQSSTQHKPGEYYLNFCTFSAALLKAAHVEAEVHPVWVFYACRDVLERKSRSSHQPRAHRLPPDQVWALDVRITAVWVRDGARALWETDYNELRQHWAAALDEKTELWPTGDGLARERWQLWRDRLRSMRTEGNSLDIETRAVVSDAADVVTNILGSGSAQLSSGS